MEKRAGDEAVFTHTGQHEEEDHRPFHARARGPLRKTRAAARCLAACASWSADRRRIAAEAPRPTYSSRLSVKRAFSRSTVRPQRLRSSQAKAPSLFLSGRHNFLEI